MNGAPVRVAPLGDRALVVRLGDHIGDAVFARVRAAVGRLHDAHPAISDVVAGFTTVTVHYEPAAVGGPAGDAPHTTLARVLEDALRDLESATLPEARLVEIPVCYEGDFAPDLDEVARHAGLTTDEVIALHTGAACVVQMIGFTPGFPYLAGLDPRLATPRRAEPRTRVPAGSVGIGGEQTGVYPMATPGGWNIIGRTPLALFDPRREPAALLRVGDRVRFVAISRERFDALLAR